MFAPPTAGPGLNKLFKPSKEKIATAFVMTVIVDRSHLLHLKYMYEQCYRVIN